MIELVTLKAPRKRAATVHTFKPRAPEGKVRPLSVQESRAALLQKFEEMRYDMVIYIRAMFSKNEGQDRDFKEIKRQQAVFREILGSFAFRLAAIEKLLNVAVTTFTPAQMKAAGLVKPWGDPPPDAMLVAYEGRIRAAVKRLEELPDPCTPMQLSAHFAIPYNSLQKFWLRGQLAITRTGAGNGGIKISRAAIAEYMNKYGVPRRSTGEARYPINAALQQESKKAKDARAKDHIAR
ncbi:MAG: hypothetical protein ABSB63_16070 [Spirochaetia bacterium]|jgi:hypothetical protein